jgi:hypothetical protein
MLFTTVVNIHTVHYFKAIIVVIALINCSLHWKSKQNNVILDSEIPTNYEVMGLEQKYQHQQSHQLGFIGCVQIVENRNKML